jgi:hypothetical protein
MGVIGPTVLESYEQPLSCKRRFDEGQIRDRLFVCQRDDEPPGSTRRAAITSSSESVLEGIPKDLEVRLALSALPPYLRSDATVYVLDPAKGYAAEQKGTNDFTCFVERTDWVRADFRNDLFIP